MAAAIEQGDSGVVKHIPFDSIIEHAIVYDGNGDPKVFDRRQIRQAYLTYLDLSGVSGTLPSFEDSTSKPIQ